MTRKVSSARHMNASTKLLRCGLSTAERRNRLRRCTVVSGRPACNTVCRGYTVLTPECNSVPVVESPDICTIRRLGWLHINDLENMHIALS